MPNRPRSQRTGGRRRRRATVEDVRHVWPALALALASTACNQLLGIEELTAGSGDGGQMTDGRIVSDGETQFCGVILLGGMTCFSRGGEPLTLTGTLDTTADPRCDNYNQDNGVGICGIYADGV